VISFRALPKESAYPVFPRVMKRSIADWYLKKPVSKLAYQMVKYRQRDGWTHRDVLRLAHPKPKDGEATRDALFKWATGNDEFKMVEDEEKSLRILEGFLKAESCTNEKEIVKLVTDYGLTREMIPTQFLNKPDVQWALLQSMPMMAMVRNLGNMSKSGLLKPMSEASAFVIRKLHNKEVLKKSRIHPLHILAAMFTYNSGKGMRGKGTWEAVQQVVDALDGAFYQTFDNVEPTGKRLLLGVDVSGSMGWGTISGIPGMTPRIGAAAMSLVTAATEPMYHIMGFQSSFVKLTISPRQRLDQVARYMESLSFGATDCALPMIWATQNKVEVDTFIIYTDSETWSGSIHPKQALDHYRQKFGINAKLIVVGMVTNRSTIADPKDPGMLDVVGFSSDVPRLISSFVSS